MPAYSATQVSPPASTISYQHEPTIVAAPIAPRSPTPPRFVHHDAIAILSLAGITTSALGFWLLSIRGIDEPKADSIAETLVLIGTGSALWKTIQLRVWGWSAVLLLDELVLAMLWLVTVIGPSGGISIDLYYRIYQLLGIVLSLISLVLQCHF